MRFHIKEKKDQDEIKALVQSKDIDYMIKGLRHPVHFDQVSATLPYFTSRNISREVIKDINIVCCGFGLRDREYERCLGAPIQAPVS
jgi:hypothetical protein